MLTERKRRFPLKRVCFPEIAKNRTIMCTSDGTTVTFSVSNNEGANVFEREDFFSEPSVGSSTYILNTNSMKFHYASCQWAEKISQKNRQEFNGSREELISQGYDPCGSCHP